MITSRGSSDHLEYLEAQKHSLEAQIDRFARPTGLMAYAGLVPSERSSGNVRRRGSITKTGSDELRRVLIEAA